jgi:hypothetical protein
MKRILTYFGILLLMAVQGLAANNCLTFDGVDDWVNTVSGALIPTSGDFTVECWAKCESNPNAYTEILSQGSSGNAFYMGTDGSGNIRIGDGWTSTGVAFPFGDWHHFAVVKSSSDTLLYIDGVHQKSLGWAIPNPEASTILWLGKQYGGFAEYWPGSIDELRVWTDVRTADEIKNNRAQLSDSDDANLKLWYTCDQAAGEGSIVDSSGNSYGGNLKNMDSTTCWDNVISVELDGEDRTVDWTVQSYFQQGETTPSMSKASWSNALNGAGSSDQNSFVIMLEIHIEDVPLSYGTNLITVIGETDDGMLDSDEITIIRESAPVTVVDITTTDMVIDFPTDTYSIVGTNSATITGNLTWSNELTGATGILPVSGSSFEIADAALEIGVNTITVSGTNIVGDVSSDSVLLSRLFEHSGDSPVHYVAHTGKHIWPFDSWDSAATNIQAAADAAAADDTVLVSNGTYRTDGAVAPGQSCTNRICITSAITVQSVNGPEVTIIEGAAGANGGCDTHSVRGAYIAQGAMLSGFTITQGYTMASGNVANQFGGGLYLESGGGATNCIVKGNVAKNSGGGTRGGILLDCTLIDNSAYQGAGASGGTLSNCVLSHNSASYYGGGASGATLAGCILSENSAYHGGGTYGGTLTGCTLSENTAVEGGGAYAGTLRNCIVWGNTATSSGNDIFNSTVSYSCASDGVTHGVNGCITSDPQLANPSTGLFELMAISPCIDTGSNAYASTNERDLAGNARIVNGTVDMGAYESSAGITYTITTYCSDGGTITPSNPSVFAGFDQSFAFAGPGYSVATILVDGTQIPAAANYTFTNVKTNHTLVVTFEPILYYVDAAQADNSGNGQSWATAKQTIQAALDLTPCGQVWVTNGIYDLGGSVAPGQSCTNRIYVANPITVQSVNGPEVTIIKGAAGANGGCDTHSVRGGYIAEGAMLSGFTITQGHTMASGEWADQFGGGLYFASGGGATSCIMKGNVAQNSGGGTSGGNLSNCVLSRNSAYQGAGASGGNLSNCVLSHNSASYYGGGASGATLAGCVLSENSAYHGGGTYGGTLRNCIVWGNSATANGDDIHNSTVSYCCASDDVTAGVDGCITNDPCFTDAANGDYTLLTNSPCINTGNNGYVTTDADLAGNVRIIDGTVDMGAYEFVVGTDTDWDGIPDTWETRYFSSVLDCVTNAYTDSDAFNNWQEYIAGTDPTDATSYFCVTNCCSEADGFLVEWVSVSGRVYSVSYASSLTDAFQTLESDIAYPKSSYTDTHIMTQGFYRVEVELED